jgi:hypothetical protein
MPDIQHPQEAERLAAALREHEGPVVELVLQCLEAQQAMNERMLDAMSALESRVDSLAHDLGRRRSVADAAEAGPSQPAPATARRRLLPLRRGRARSCAVCKREVPRGSKREVSSAGWTIAGKWGVCPQCHATGWRVSEGGGLPFRPRATGGT